MKNIEKINIRAVIYLFFDKKSGVADIRAKLEKILAELTEDKESDHVAALRAELAEAEAVRNEKFSFDTWMQKAANSMAKSLRLGTHLSKGVHPDSRGDNINFDGNTPLPEGVVGSQVIGSGELDASGGAAALPLAGLLDTVVDETHNIKILDLLKANHPALEGAFSDDLEQSKQYVSAFQAVLENKLEQPKTFELNKQLLWPLSDVAIKDDNYATLIPLHPSVLTHQVYQKINTRYSDENKQAKDNRNKNSKDQQAYFSMHDIALLKLGGANPQNVSQLMARQGGRNYLLPSVPPKFMSSKSPIIKKSDETIFNKRFEKMCKEEFKELKEVIDSKNNVEVRDRRKEALDMILAKLLNVVEAIQITYPAGWSKEYENLNKSEQYLLDPGRCEIDEDFEEEKLKNNWINEIEHAFAFWINNTLKKLRPRAAFNIGDAEYKEWCREMRDAIKASQRAKRKIFNE